MTSRRGSKTRITWSACSVPANILYSYSQKQIGRMVCRVSRRVRVMMCTTSCMGSKCVLQSSPTYNICYFAHIVISINHTDGRGPGSVVGIATGYGLYSPGIESQWREIFLTCSDRPWGPPSPLYNRYRVFPGGKERSGRDADPSPPSSAVVMKG
jgi:hypothetical protein